MKKIVLAVMLTASLAGYNANAQKNAASQVLVSMDLNVVKDDRVMVTVMPPKSSASEMTYHIPKIIPGTYSEDDYGQFIVDFKALDKKGNELESVKLDVNSWSIKNATKVAKITYWVNDTYDSEKGGGFGEEDVFSPAGTNIEEGKNFMLNNHAFVGYFNDTKDITYRVNISHPEALFGATSLIDTDASAKNDVFVVARYNDLVDNPIMYSKPDLNTFTVDGMEITFSVYSPTSKHNAKDLSADLEKMMRAQKKFLGPINNNKKYTVILYLSDMKKADAKGFGALEHSTSTTVVFPEMMQSEMLGKQLIDVVSHEFFHIVTPLSIHSKEIHFFDFNEPKMSKHLWLYEGVTEYFANLFQINQGLISEDDFYKRMLGKIEGAKRMNDTMSFTEMSANVLTEPYKAQYLNVYEKGALIGMCIDIIIREQSNGEKGILDLIKKLATEFGSEKPFDDEALFNKIVQLTYPEVGTFLTTHVSGTTPISYDTYFAKVGVNKGKIQIATNPFLKGQSPYVTINPSTKEIVVIPETELNEFMTSLGIKGGDTILEINGKSYNLDNIYEMIMESQNWKTDDAISIKIKRNDKEETINGKVKLSFEEKEGYQTNDTSKTKLNQAWLKG